MFRKLFKKSESKKVPANNGSPAGPSKPKLPRSKSVEDFLDTPAPQRRRPAPVTATRDMDSGISWECRRMKRKAESEEDSDEDEDPSSLSRLLFTTPT